MYRIKSTKGWGQLKTDSKIEKVGRNENVLAAQAKNSNIATVIFDFKFFKAAKALALASSCFTIG